MEYFKKIENIPRQWNGIYILYKYYIKLNCINFIKDYKIKKKNYLIFYDIERNISKKIILLKIWYIFHDSVIDRHCKLHYNINTGEFDSTNLILIYFNEDENINLVLLVV